MSRYQIENTGLKLESSDNVGRAFTVEINARKNNAAVTNNVKYTLPAMPAVGQLTCDINGNLSWA